MLEGLKSCAASGCLREGNLAMLKMKTGEEKWLDYFPQTVRNSTGRSGPVVSPGVLSIHTQIMYFCR